MKIAGPKNLRSSRFLVVLCLALSFLLPYFAGVLVERALVVRWQKYGFTPDQTRSWWDQRVYSRSTAIAWRASGFQAPEIEPWAAMDVPPREAKEWRDAGADVTTAAEWRRNAFAPSRAADWMRLQFTVGDAIGWRKHGFEAEEAARWREKGMNAAAAAGAGRSEVRP